MRRADLRIENGTIVTATGQTTGGLAVRDGTIVAVGDDDSLPTADQTVDAEGCVVLPGFVDEHVHDRSLGQTQKEDWETVTRAAAVGGVTTVLGHGNTDPYIDRPAHLERKRERGRRDSVVDFGCFAWLTAENYDDIETLATDAVGVQASLDERAPTRGELLTAMERLGALGERLAIHVEDGEIVAERRQRRQERGDATPREHCRSRPPVAEHVGAATVVELAEQTDCPVHVLQVSAGSTLERLVRGRNRGVDLTVETTPHYLWFSEEEMGDLGHAAVMSPPLRSDSERARLLSLALDAGELDCIGTDHAPHTDAEKHLDETTAVWDVAPGSAGVETGPAAMATLAARGRLSYSDVVDLYSTTPARIWGLYPQKGSLRVGTDADITVVDPDLEWTVDRTELHSKSTATVWDNETVTGRVQTTVLRGNLVYHDGTVRGDTGYGRPVG